MKAIIFDMDGVIFDSERAVFEGWMELSRKYGFKNLEVPYRKCIGVNSAASRKIFLDYYGEGFPYDEYCKEQSQEYHRKYDHGRLPLKKGVKELLQYLKANDYLVAIGSSTRTALVEQQIKDAGLFEYFDHITGGDQVSKSKPEPDIFLKAAEGFISVDVNRDERVKQLSQIIVVEDSYNGIRGAKAAGMFPIMVPDMMEPDEEMRNTAGAILEDLLCVREFLDNGGFNRK